MPFLFHNKSYKEIDLNTTQGYDHLNLVNINISKDNSHFSIMLPACNATHIFKDTSTYNKINNFDFRYIYDEVINKDSSLIFNKREFNKLDFSKYIIEIKSELINLLIEIILNQ
jgi:hypothetical protein